MNSRIFDVRGASTVVFMFFQFKVPPAEQFITVNRDQHIKKLQVVLVNTYHSFHQEDPLANLHFDKTATSNMKG